MRKALAEIAGSNAKGVVFLKFALRAYNMKYGYAELGTQAVRENAPLTFKLSDTRAGKRVLGYFQSKILGARAAGSETAVPVESTQGGPLPISSCSW
jgi:hypothetical protein